MNYDIPNGYEPLVAGDFITEETLFMTWLGTWARIANHALTMIGKKWSDQQVAMCKPVQSKHNNKIVDRTI